MPNQDTAAFASYWRSRANHLAQKVNFHHWLARVVPKLLGLLIVLAVFELIRREAAQPTRLSAALFCLGIALVSGWAWMEARRHFCTWQQAMVRLETVLGLHNQLSAAQAGVVPWPQPPQEIHDGYSRNWRRIVLPLLAGCLFLFASHFVPVSLLRAAVNTEPITPPPEFAQLQKWIDALKAEDLVQPEKLQDMQSKLDELRNRPAEDWYKQDDLEAASTLKESMEQSINSLSQDLDHADSSVQAMEKKEEENAGDTSGLQPMEDDLRKAGDNLASGNLPLKKEITEALTGGEAATDKQLTLEQLKALHNQLQKGAAHTAGICNGGLSEEMQEAMAAAGMGMGQRPGQGPGQPGDQDGPGGPGSGGTGGGKTSAPLDLQARDKDTPEGPLTKVQNDDMNHALPGETLKVTSGDPKVDPASYVGPQSAGTANVQGNGGEAVWRSTYDPQEADTLTRFFK